MRRWIYGLAILVFMIVIVGCHDKCTPNTTRCSGNTAQVCNTNKDWEEMSDCDEASEGTPFVFECQWSEEDDQHVCVPTNLPAGDGGDAG